MVVTTTGTQPRPRIGITPDINDLAAPDTEYVIRRNYADTVLRAGGLPFLLPYNGESKNYLTVLDGLLISRVAARLLLRCAAVAKRGRRAARPSTSLER